MFSPSKHFSSPLVFVPRHLIRPGWLGERGRVAGADTPWSGGGEETEDTVSRDECQIKLYIELKYPAQLLEISTIRTSFKKN